MQTLWLPSAKSRWGNLKDTAKSPWGNLKDVQTLWKPQRPPSSASSPLCNQHPFTSPLPRADPHCTWREKRRGKALCPLIENIPKHKGPRGRRAASRQQNSSPAIPGKDQSRMKQNPSGLERSPGSWRVIRCKGFSTLAWLFKHLHSTEKKKKEEMAAGGSNSLRVMNDTSAGAGGSAGSSASASFSGFRQVWWSFYLTLSG